MTAEIQAQLDQLALSRSTPFCYHCYTEAPTGRCNACGSDDLMRLVAGVGCEYGLDWIASHILETELSPINLEEAFEESMRECYPETTVVGWASMDTVRILKKMDPVSWRCAVADWESAEAAEGNIVTLDNGTTYFWLYDVESLLR